VSLPSGTKANVADWVKPMEVVDLTQIDYRVQSLEEIVAFERSEHDTPKKRAREEQIKPATPSSDEAEEAGPEEDEEEERQTRVFEKKCQGEISFSEEERDSDEEESGRHKVQRFSEDDEEEATATTFSSASTTPYSQSITLKDTIGRTPHHAIVTAKKGKGKKNKGKN
jgi:hypothetical protein